MRWIAFGGIALGLGALFWLLSALMAKTTGGSINPGQYGRGRYMTSAATVGKPKPPRARKHH